MIKVYIINGLYNQVLELYDCKDYHNNITNFQINTAMIDLYVSCNEMN